MRITAKMLWAWTLGHLMNTAIGAVFRPRRSLVGDSSDLSSLNKIFGGYECPSHSQPWMAALLKNNVFECGGALVHPQWVLTVAHCFKLSYTVGLGMHSLNPPRERGSQMIPAKLSVRHPQYDPVRHSNDLMLIKLSKPAVESVTVKPIIIASQCPVNGTRCLVSGWGLASYVSYAQSLQCMEATVVSENSCRQAHPRLSFHKMFCAGDDHVVTSTCNGDSGSPLVCDKCLHGIVLGSQKPCGQTGLPDVYIKLCEYEAWIEETIKTR